MIRFLDARYGKHDQEIQKIDYAGTLNSLFAEKPKFNTLEDYLDFIDKLKAHKIHRLSEVTSDIYDLSNKKRLIKDRDLFEQLYGMKSMLLDLLKGSKLSTKKKSQLIYFFRFHYKNDLTEDEIKEVMEQRGLMKFYKTDDIVQETRLTFDFEHHQTVNENTQTMASSVEKIRRSKYFYINQYGEKFIRLEFRQSKDSEDVYPVYIPAMIKSTYRVNRRMFVQSLEYNSFVNKRGLSIKPFISTTINYIKAIMAYKLEDLDVATNIIQQKMLTIFYEKQNFYPSNQEYSNYAQFMSQIPFEKTLDQEEFSIKNLRTFNVFKDVTDLTSLEARTEFFKVHFMETPNISKSGSELESNWGKKGFMNYSEFPLDKINTDLFDPTMVSTTGDFLFTYRDNLKTPLATELSMWNAYNKISIRNSMGSYTALKALPLKKHDNPLTSNGIKSRFFSNIPTITLWMVNEEDANFTTSDGFSTTEGMRIIDPEVAKSYGIYMGMKLATKDLNKGVVSISKTDRFFFMHNGEKIYLSIMSPKDMFSRKNFGSFIESLYNGQKYLDGKLKHEVRDIETNPIKESELLDFKEVFRETKDNVISLGMKSVGLWTLHYVHETDTTFDDEEEDDNVIKDAKFTLGVEAMQRLFLNGMLLDKPYILDQFIKTSQKRKEIINKITPLYSTKELNGKNGKITNLYKYKGLGFNSTVVGNAHLQANEKHLYLIKEDIPKLVTVLKTFLRDNVKLFNEMKHKLMNCIPFDLPEDILVRNPSIDDANFIVGYTKLFYADERFNKSILMVNPSSWARQGGDFDGDQGYIMFFRPAVHNLIKDIYPLHKLTIKDIEVRESLIHKDLQNYLDNYATLKGKGHITVKDMLSIKSSEEIKEAARLDVVVVFIGKKSVGLAKSVTMRPLAYITAYIYHNYTKLDSRAKKIIKSFLNWADDMNSEMVQKTIDISKWAHDIDSVIKTVVEASVASKTVAYKIKKNMAVDFIFEDIFFLFEETKNMRVDLEDWDTITENILDICNVHSD